MHEEQRKLQREAKSLAQRLEAVLQDKFAPRNSFDADTPIDKTLQFLQKVIAVCVAIYGVCMTVSSSYGHGVGRLHQQDTLPLHLYTCC